MKIACMNERMNAENDYKVTPDLRIKQFENCAKYR